MTDISYTDKSISVDKGPYYIYYGEKEADYFTGEWSMVIIKNHKEKARYTNSELLEDAQGERPVDLFIAGLVKYFCK